MKKIYFLSDLHLGARTLENPLENERRVVRWFDSVKEDASAIYLMGDIAGCSIFRSCPYIIRGEYNGKKELLQDTWCVKNVFS